MNQKELKNYKYMYSVLKHIANDFENPEEMYKSAENVGLTREEYLEMAYENMQGVAQGCLANIDET